MTKNVLPILSTILLVRVAIPLILYIKFKATLSPCKIPFVRPYTSPNI